MTIFRQQLAAKGMSKRSRKSDTKSRRKGNQSICKSTWKQTSWCHKQEADSFQCPAGFVLEFFDNLFRSGYSYKSM